jgi:hypothetical protein
MVIAFYHALPCLLFIKIYEIMNKNYLANKTRLKYTGQHFEGFQQERPYMTFLGYDCGGWYTIWVEYLGNIMFVMLNDVELTAKL